jgi:hypothetical protein
LTKEDMSKSEESKSENKGKKIVMDIAKTLTSVVDQSESQLFKIDW